MRLSQIKMKWKKEIKRFIVTLIHTVTRCHQYCFFYAVRYVHILNMYMLPCHTLETHTKCTCIHSTDFFDDMHVNTFMYVHKYSNTIWVWYTIVLYRTYLVKNTYYKCSKYTERVCCLAYIESKPLNVYLYYYTTYLPFFWHYTQHLFDVIIFLIRSPRTQ